MATTTPRSCETISLTLTIDSSSDKVVFAEAGKEFVDFLFGLLQIPIGSMMGLLLDNGMVCVWSSLQIIPSTPRQSFAFGPSLNPVGSSVVQLEEKGYVRGVVTYRVMDDLRVMPMPVMSTTTVLKTLNIKDVNSLQEKTVEVDIEKGLELVMVSLRSATVLTEVFLGHKRSYALF
ncbi:hypothetical protein CJ030_MR1G025243 [Morella rubra]|uniref:Uncharacterized protein n=1 Tax=Morella rubra TaxID=262757 RepID=A0A6A1WNA2_9ROSI|nr:hypothetical protein CJ030_MR1G025243 [Morella rubra]